MLITTSNLVERLIIQHLNLTRLLLRHTRLHPSLLSDKPRQAVKVPTPLVVLRLVTLPIKPLQRREPLDAKALAQLAVLVRIDLAHADLVADGGERLADFLVDGSESLAVAAPGGEELHQSWFAGFQHDAVEVLGGQIGHGGGCDDAREEREAAHEQDAQTSHGVIGIEWLCRITYSTRRKKARKEA